MLSHRFTSLFVAAIVVLVVAGQAHAQAHVTPPSGLRALPTLGMRTGPGDLRLALIHRSDGWVCPGLRFK
jgi:hypothetical protein